MKKKIEEDIKGIKLDRVCVESEVMNAVASHIDYSFGETKSKLDYVPLGSLFNTYPNNIRFDRSISLNKEQLNLKFVHPKLIKRLGGKEASKSILYDNLVFHSCCFNKISPSEIKRQILLIKNSVQEWVNTPVVNTNVQKYKYITENYWKNVLLGFNQNYLGYSSFTTLADCSLMSSLGFLAKVGVNNILNEVLCVLMVKREFTSIVKMGMVINETIPSGLIEAWIPDDIDTGEYSNQTLRGALKKNIYSDIINRGIEIIPKSPSYLNREIWKGLFVPKFKTVDEKNVYTEGIIRDFIEKQKIELGIKKIAPKFSFSKVKTGIKSSQIERVDIRERENVAQELGVVAQSLSDLNL